MIGRAPSDQPRLSGTNLVRAADHNQRVTLHAIRVMSPLTRVELARITGLTGPAIANITRRLLQEGLIEEAGQRRGGRGQPPTKLVVKRDACYAIGVNIDRDHITIVLVDFAGKTLARVSEEVAFALPERVRALYRDSIRAMVRSADVDIAKVVGLGVALPDELGRVALPGRPQSYAVWDQVDLASLFDQPFELPVFVENDAAAAAMGEMQLGHGQSHSSFFYILLSSGLGGGVVIDGNYIRGATGRSGELGFLRTPPHDATPGEQIQTLVSLSGLARHLAQHGQQLSALLQGETAPALAACVADWIARAADQLTVPIDAINCLLNPSAILLGGRLPTAQLDALAARTNAVMRARAALLPSLAPIRRAALSADAPAVGAAILPFSHFLLPRPGTLWKAHGQSEGGVAGLIRAG